jgi:AhpD family alkylhydroperoxidase
MDAATVEARMTNPAFVLPGAMDALMALNKSVQRSRVPAKMLELMSLRASQVNGCGVCAVQHPRIARTLGETDSGVVHLSAYRSSFVGRKAIRTQQDVSRW